MALKATPTPAGGAVPDWMAKAAARAEEIFSRHGVHLTLGGEPTFVPLKPEGAEWTYSAVGPTKLDYAWKVARAIRRRRLSGAAVFFCPGKSYPGEVNPRWVIRLLANRDGTPLFRLPARGSSPTPASTRTFVDALCRDLGVPSQWAKLSDPLSSRSVILTMPLDHEEGIWRSARWPLAAADRHLSEAEGPAGLRLPLHLLPEELPRRVLTIEFRGDSIAVFFPPLLQAPFLELLAAVEMGARQARLADLELQGYLPPDETARWINLGLAADPGVLEINLPACANFLEYAEWTALVTACCEDNGLRSWKEPVQDFPQGTGGGNHLLWGGPTLDEHPFFSRPAWLAAILRYWQRHPSLAYLFTGCYVGPSSQAPRPDESARDLYDVNMAYAFLESLPEGDHRVLINETLRHLQTDVTGNSHRSEVSFDKFWNPASPAGALGLVEFRAIESLPRADWMSAVALLWTVLAARLLEAPASRRGLHRFGTKLHDAFFLPETLWRDLSEILAELDVAGISLDAATYRAIWEWRFPLLLRWQGLTVRRALDGWPLLCETPVEGGATSRFVDTSMQRLEFLADGDFAKNYAVHVAGRLLELHPVEDGACLAGLRYRRTNLYPALHPGIPIQVPLHVSLVDRARSRVVAEFRLALEDREFQEVPPSTPLRGKPCRGGRRGDLTCDLRLE